VIKIALFL